MSTYTTPLWKAIEYAGDNGLNDYPIFNEAYRETLNQRILEHYDEQEIGLESPIRFVFALRRRMHEIMPKYNKLYESERLVIDPLNTVNMVRTSVAHADTTNSQTVDANGVTDSVNDGTANTVSSGSSNNTTHDETDTTVTNDGTSDTTTHDVNDTDTTTNNRARTTNSAMPQGRLGGDKDYATSGTDVVSGVDTSVDSITDGTTNVVDSSTQVTGTVSDGTNNTVTGDTSDVTTNDVGKTTTSNTTEGVGTSEENSNSTDTEKGWNGNQSEMLLKYRETFLNIDLQVIQELGDLFMLLWNTSDDYENKVGYGYGY